jgi:lysophospholipase L1-like esterase
MTPRATSFLVSLVLALSPLSASELLRPGDVVAICGDSITEQKMYSRFIEDYLVMCQPVPDVKAFQVGWSGERAPGFLKRMKNDVLPFQPTVATLCYGMNDGGYAAPKAEALGTYRKALTEIVKTFQQSGVRTVVVASPGVVDSHTFRKPSVTAEVYNQTLAELGEAAREVAVAEKATFANVNGEMAAVMPKAKAKYGETYHVAGGDGVHPAANGHLVMAYAFLKALGCEGDIGRITLDMAAGQADATRGHKVVKAGKEFVEIESTRYPFCFSGDPSNPSSPRGVLEFLPFNEDLNRFVLVVKNPPAGILRVTWGDVSREYSAAELEKGINLAAAFPDNPFSKPFQTVDAKVQEKQAFETQAIRVLLNSLPTWEKVLPEDRELFGRLKETLVEKTRSKDASVRAAVVPVTHTIRIEPAS